MPRQPRPTHCHRASTPRRLLQRPWSALPAAAQKQLAQEFALLLQRILDTEASHADHVE
jgi:hypothetical protein